MPPVFCGRFFVGLALNAVPDSAQRLLALNWDGISAVVAKFCAVAFWQRMLAETLLDHGLDHIVRHVCVVTHVHFSVRLASAQRNLVSAVHAVIQMYIFCRQSAGHHILARAVTERGCGVAIVSFQDLRVLMICPHVRIDCC